MVLDAPIPAPVCTLTLSRLASFRADLPSQINVRSCYGHCTVKVDMGLRNLLREDPPGLAFEAWLHGAVLDPADFNQA